MKIRRKFILTYSFGAFIAMIIISLAISAFIAIFDFYWPLDKINQGAATLLVLGGTFLPVLTGGGLLGIWLVRPVLLFILLLRKLSNGDYDVQPQISSLYKRRNKKKLKSRYRLYEEVFGDFLKLSAFLTETERSRKEQEENKKNWIAGVSHDLKTPLSYITGCAELLLTKEYEFDPQERTQLLQSIYDKGLTIGELISDLNLSFKMEDIKSELPLNKSTFDFVDFMRRQIADIINDPRAEGYDIAFQCEIQQIEINADRRLLQRAFQNIIMNGILHNPAGTSIYIAVKLTPDNKTRTEIRDNGRGMDEDTVKNIFSRYYRNPSKEDTNFSGGLGVSVAKNIFEAHGGTIGVSSVPSLETLFTVTI